MLEPEEFDYRKEVHKTLSDQFHDVDHDLLHAAMGLADEAGEIIGAVKKAVFYGKELDLVNLKEECGDMRYFLEVLEKAIGTTREEVEQLNIKKLRARHGETFSADGAINRDLDKERSILEGNE